MDCQRKFRTRCIQFVMDKLKLYAFLSFSIFQKIILKNHLRDNIKDYSNPLVDNPKLVLVNNIL